MRTAVVILNWNTREYLERWLPALSDSCSTVSGAEVVVADSGSTDGSLEMMGGRFPGIMTIPLGGNYGFTGGYNRALSQLEAEYYVLINSDIEVGSDWLAPLVEWMDSHPECGVCGPKLHALDCRSDGGSKSYVRTGRFEYAGAAGGFLDRYGYPFCRGRVMKRVENDFGQYDSPAEVMWTSGACMMVRSSLWHELGGLDDRFFAHMEEIDFCWRARLSGWTVNVVPKSVVWHLGGGTLPQTSPFKLKLNYRNNLLMLDKNLPHAIGKRKAGFRIFVRKCLDVLSGLAYLLEGKPSYTRSVFQAHREYRRLASEAAAAPSCESGIRMNGVCDIDIILQSFLHGNRIFEYLRQYEHNN